MAWPARWELQRELATLYLRAGMFKSSLHLFQGLRMWEDVVACLVVMNQRQRAAELIEERLKEQRTPDLLCMLGGLRQDESYFLEAWKLSGQCQTTPTPSSASPQPNLAPQGAMHLHPERSH